MRGYVHFLLALALFSAVGCVSVQRAENFNNVNLDNNQVPLAAIEIENSSWLLLNFIPLGSGDPDHPNVNTCRYFRNTVSLENNMKVMDRILERDGVSTVANLTSRYTDEKYLIFLLARRACHTSCVLIKPTGTPKEEVK